MVWMWRLENNSVELVISYIYTGSRNQTQVVKHLWQVLYPLSHLNVTNK